MKKVRLAASGDLHIHETSEDLFKPAFKDLHNQADILALAGDLTASGQLKEVRTLLHELRSVKIPIVAVLGNHEFHNRKQDKIKKILLEEGIHVLDGGYVQFELNGLTIGFSGAKGFLAGFDKRAIPDFGEESLRLLVDELFHEMNKMRDGLKQLKTDIKVLLMHYSPTRDTLKGEHPEIYAFLGSHVLGLPADEFNADLILHGHCHYGVEKGFSEGGTPVRNVCVPVLKKPYTVYDLPLS
jgi:Icc-related predicted phosphoesterase